MGRRGGLSDVFPEMDSKHRGAQAELTACAWLLTEGYEVFRNVSAHGVADIVAIKGADTLRINVRAVSDWRDKSLPASLPEDQIAQGIVGLYVFSDGRCDLDLERRYQKHPKLEGARLAANNGFSRAVIVTGLDLAGIPDTIFAEVDYSELGRAKLAADTLANKREGMRLSRAKRADILNCEGQNQ